MPKVMLLLVQAAGILLSAVLIFVTFADRSQIEHRVQDLAFAKVEEATSIEWDKATGGMKGEARTEKFNALTERLGTTVDEMVTKREDLVRALVRETLWDKCVEPCSYPKLVEFVDELAIAKIAQLRLDERSAKEFIVERYESTVRGLISDLRRFGLVNIVVLSLMMALVLFRKHLNWRFFAFSVGLTTYTTWAAYGYLINQDWVRALIFQDWAAPGYQMAMVFQSFILLDRLFLDGKIMGKFLHAVIKTLQS